MTMSTLAANAPSAAGGGLADVAASEASLRRFLHGLPGVDQVGLEARAATLGTRSIKTTAKAYAIDLAISMIDLTTLEGADTVGKVRSLCTKGRNPDPSDPTAPGSRRSASIRTWSPPRRTPCAARTSRSPRSPRPSRPAGSRCR
ncbi:hypothetical protein GCM10025734_36050 [Kitasatospora paranensis]